MTEDEAKTKWCPKVEHRGLGKCIASACMAWRFESPETYEERYTNWEDAANIGGVNRGPEPLPEGFCGLAGRP